MTLPVKLYCEPAYRVGVGKKRNVHGKHSRVFFEALLLVSFLRINI